MVYSADCLFCILRRGLYRCAFYALRRLVYPISHYITPCNRAFQPFFIDDHKISAAALAALRLLAVLSLYCLRRRALPARLYENLGSRAFSGDLPRSDAVQAVEKCAIKLLRTSIATQKAAPESQKT